MGDIIQCRQFLSRLATKSSKPLHPDAIIPQTAEKSLNNETASPRSASRVAGVQSGIAQYAGAWTEKEMIHLLRRTMFGAAKKDVDKIRSLSMSAAVDLLIDNPVVPLAPVNNYTAVADTAGVKFGDQWVDAVSPSVITPIADPSDATINSTLNSTRISSSFKPWWMGLMISQNTHIMDKLTLFWANHFGTSTADNAAKAIYQHHKLFRTYGMTNFRDLIKQVTLDPHMLYFLNGNNSSKPTPNENYARELQELFTIGKGPDSHYTEDDVKAAARALSGWTVTKSITDGTYSSALVVSTTTGLPTKHDTANKVFSSFYGNQTIVGKTDAAGAAAEVDALLNMILSNTECAKYLVRCLYRWFVYSDIPADVETNVITPLANIFRSSNYDIPAVLKALFKSEHFFDSAVYGGIIKSPVDLYAGMIREFNLTLAASPIDIKYAHWKSFSDKCTTELQNIGDPPNVSGWPAYAIADSNYYEVWMSNSSIQVKANNLINYVKNGVTQNGVKLQVDGIAFNKQFADPVNPLTVVQNFVLYLLPMDLTPDQLTALNKILTPDGENVNTYWSSRWNMYVSKTPATPAEIANAADVQGILRSLIYSITGLAEYFLY